MSSLKQIVIVDYGMGNLFNLHKVLAALGTEPIITNDPEQIINAERLILPGVGAFEDGIKNLTRTGMDEALRAYVQTGKLLLGICLGMQLLMQESDEGGVHQGLGLVEGRVEKFLPPLIDAVQYKIPHIGWNTLQSSLAFKSWDQTLFAKIGQEDYVYFVHSYTVCPSSDKVILSQTAYGRQVFCSALKQENILGCQFHPEISGPVGLNILNQFLTLSN